MTMVRTMLTLVVTAWLHGHMVGATGLGLFTANGRCDDRGEQVVETLYRAQKRRRPTKAKRLQFRYRCSEWDALRA
jgi:hypothetical protein